MVKQLKNRYNDPTMYKRFVIGIDRAKMRLYDCEQSAQDDVLDKGKEEEYDFEERKPKNLLKDSNSEIMTVDTDKYLEFVHGVTSPPSLDYPVLSARLSQLEVPMALMLLNF